MDLHYRQTKIQAKRKATPWRQFLMEIASNDNLILHRNNGLISRFPNTDRSGPLYAPQEYLEKFGDGSEGIEYSGNNFLEILTKLFYQTPKMSQIHYGDNVHCEYSETVFGAKNGYLSFIIGDNAENILYSTMVYGNVTNVYNSVLVTSNSENVYNSKLITDSYNIYYSKYIHNSNNLWFCDNCIGCSECIMCSDMENQTYQIQNIQHSKEEYFIRKKEILSKKNLFSDYYSNITKDAINRASENSIGSGIQFSENIENGYFVSRFRNARNIGFADGTPLSENIYDSFDVGTCNNVYAWMGCGQGCDNMYCGANASACSHIYYCYFMGNCSFCLGCIGLKNKSYCILNKQYSKEEWYAKVDEIFTQMDTDGTLGEFFPAGMNPFYFNDTAAYLIDPSFTKEEVVAKGYLWRDEPIKVDIPAGAEVVKTSELGDYEGSETKGRIQDYMDHPEGTSSRDPSLHSGGQKEGQQRSIDPSIIKKIIQDPEGNIYKVVPMEYDFLIKHGLPLPRKHWLDRMKENFRIT